MISLCSWISGIFAAISACAAALSAYYTRKTLQKSNEDRKIALLTERAIYYKNLFTKTSEFSKKISKYSQITIGPDQADELQRFLREIASYACDIETQKILGHIAAKIKQPGIVNDNPPGSIAFYKQIYMESLFSNEQQNILKEIIDECKEMNTSIEKKYYEYEKSLDALYKKILEEK